MNISINRQELKKLAVVVTLVCVVIIIVRPIILGHTLVMSACVALVYVMLTTKPEEITTHVKNKYNEIFMNEVANKNDTKKQKEVEDVCLDSGDDC